jgi:NTP pyrophosphatase (non-canonical NTP hydrolase)
MPMSHKGISKAVEEMGEALQVLGKVLAYGLGTHPDGSNLKERLEEELGDVDAAIYFLIHKLELDDNRMIERRIEKVNRFMEWDADPNNNSAELPAAVR